MHQIGFVIAIIGFRRGGSRHWQGRASGGGPGSAGPPSRFDSLGAGPLMCREWGFAPNLAIVGRGPHVRFKGRAPARWGPAGGESFPAPGVRAIGKEGPLGAVRDRRDLRVVSQFDEGPLIANSRHNDEG